jgi:hypothetical protein
MVATAIAVCEICRQQMVNGISCAVHHVQVNGVKTRRLRADREHVCHDCGAPWGGFHHQHCDMEECPSCSGQLITCDCRLEHYRLEGTSS